MAIESIPLPALTLEDLRSEHASVRAGLLTTPLGTIAYSHLEMRIEMLEDALEDALVEAGPDADPCTCGAVESVWPGQDIAGRHFLRCQSCGRSSRRFMTPDLASITWNAGEVESDSPR